MDFSETLEVKVVDKNGLRLREYPPVFEEQAVMRALSMDGEGEPWFVPLVGSFEDSDNFYFLMVRVGAEDCGAR